MQGATDFVEKVSNYTLTVNTVNMETNILCVRSLCNDKNTITIWKVWFIFTLSSRELVVFSAKEECFDAPGENAWIVQVERSCGTRVH